MGYNISNTVKNGARNAIQQQQAMNNKKAIIVVKILNGGMGASGKTPNFSDSLRS